MKRVILATILATGILSATDFTSMSTEELVNLKGTVATEEREAFRTEMQSRVSAMATEERVALGIAPGRTGNSYGTTARDGSGIGSMGESSGGMGGSDASGGMGGDGAGGGMGGGHGGGRK